MSKEHEKKEWKIVTVEITPEQYEVLCLIDDIETDLMEKAGKIRGKIRSLHERNILSRFVDDCAEEVIEAIVRLKAHIVSEIENSLFEKIQEAVKNADKRA